MSGETAQLHDPRVRLVREKYFSVRPKPLERWLWSKNIPASAERVFWLHWQEGQVSGTWCSEISLRRVASECDLDVSTVTRAYQCLIRLGCIRRTDPGRDAANPFQQATALTEVRIPRELLQELHRYPNRRQSTDPNQSTEPGRAQEQTPSAANQSSHSPEPTLEDMASGDAIDANPIPQRTALKDGSLARTTRATTTAATTVRQAPQLPSALSALTGRDRAKAIAETTQLLSTTERDAYHQALRLHLSTMPFDADSKVPEERRTFLLATLTTLAADNPASTTPHPSIAPQSPKPTQRNLSLFHIARLKRDIQTATSTSTAPELLRQVIWSIEAGSLRRFAPLHALNIALKKIRQGSWTRPHRMPPNWARSLNTAAHSIPSPHETCSAA